MKTVVTLPVQGDAPALEAQLEFHLHAGAAAVVVGDGGLAEERRRAIEPWVADGRAAVARPAELTRAALGLGADWVLPVGPDEFWWPRGARYGEILALIPAELDVIQALVRPFLRVAGGADRPFEAATHRLSAEAYAHEPGALAGPQRRLAHRAGVDVGSYGGGIVPSALRPLRGWYPIEVLWQPPSATQDAAELEAGMERGVVQADTRLRDMLDALRAGERPGFPRPSVVENAWYAVDAAVLGEADTFRLRDELDELERRLAGLEENLLVRADRKVRSVLRRGRS